MNFHCNLYRIPTPSRISPPPSPFIDRTAYDVWLIEAQSRHRQQQQEQRLHSHKSELELKNRNRLDNKHTSGEALGSPISSGEDEMLLGNEGARTPDDRMSLSSLSSADDKIIEDSSEQHSSRAGPGAQFYPGYYYYYYFGIIDPAHKIPLFFFFSRWRGQSRP